MNRLTTRKAGIYVFDNISKTEDEYIEKENQMVQKFGQLEDVEEELGIDLIKFVKVLKAPEIYVKSRNEILEVPHCDICWDIEVNKISIVLEEDKNHTLYSIYHLKDYGKTWALTKEELE